MHMPSALSPSRYNSTLMVDPRGGLPTDRSQIPNSFAVAPSRQPQVNKVDESGRIVPNGPPLLFYFGVGVLALVVIRIVVK